MDEIRLDAATAEALRRAATGAKLIGPDGKPVGTFVAPFYESLVERAMAEDRRRAIDEANAEVTLEDLIAADQAGGEIPHEEVLKRLGL